MPAPETGRPTRRRPPGRYDEPSLAGQRVLAVFLGGLFLALVTTVALVLYSRFGAEEVRVEQIGFSVLSDTQVRVDFAVTKPPGATAYCLVRSRNAFGAEAGREIVAVGPAADAAGRVVVGHRLTTVDRAVTGEVPRCSLQPPAQESRP